MEIESINRLIEMFALCLPYWNVLLACFVASLLVDTAIHIAEFIKGLFRKKENL